MSLVQHFSAKAAVAMDDMTSDDEDDSAVPTGVRALRDGEALFRSGDPAVAVYRVIFGAIVLRPASGDAPRLLNDGDIFGGDGLIAGTARGATAISVGDTRVGVWARADALATLEARPEIQASLIEAVGKVFARFAKPATVIVRLLPWNPRVAEQIGEGGVTISRFPFFVGRAARRPGADLETSADLCLHDKKPHQISRRHFAIERHATGFFVRDCGSYPGTIVNRQLIGGAMGRTSQPLTIGSNEIIAGAEESPFRFELRLGLDASRPGSVGQRASAGPPGQVDRP